MASNSRNIQLISAPSILGLKPAGVEDLAKSLLASGLGEVLRTDNKVAQVDTLNSKYSSERDVESNVLNAIPIREFSLALGKVVNDALEKNRFPVVLGGDCSILIGIMSMLKAKGHYGLIFLDAHADFYQPEKSIAGEVADMDLAIVTGRGPEILTNLSNNKPYVKDEDVIHLGQRDWEETKKYGSEDIQETAIRCFDLPKIKKLGMRDASNEILQLINASKAEGFWIHYDTDVLSDDINPAVDYRLPGGLQFEEVEYFLKNLLLSGRMVGMTITIFNPQLDIDGRISDNIVKSLGRVFC
jgi:arginase